MTFRASGRVRKVSLRTGALPLFPWVFCVLLAIVQACQPSTSQQFQKPPEERTPAPVMGWQGADWLLREERIQEEQPDRMLAALEIPKGSTVADVGAGVGYHTWRLADIVGPTGKVIAEDIQPEMIEMLEKNIRSRGLTNVQVILGTPENPGLPEGVVDLVLMVDVYHEIANPEPMLKEILKALKPNGRLVLVEFRAEDRNVPILPAHKMSIRQARGEIEPRGFRFDKNLDFLPWQHIMIFRK